MSFFDDDDFWKKEKAEEEKNKDIPDPEEKAKRSKHKPKEPAEEKSKAIPINKYSSGPTKRLYESVFISEQPFFLFLENELPQTIEDIKEDFRTLRPPTVAECFTRPYKFENTDELMELFKIAQTLTADKLYEISSHIWHEYIYHKEFVIDLLAADTILTYFQDRFSTTFYVFIVGEGSSGKGTIIELMDLIGYRPYRSSSVSHASLYRVLSSIEEGQAIMLLDEVNRLSDDSMETHKVGYKGGSIILRVDESGTGTRKVTRYFTFGQRIFVAEHAFEGEGAKGLNERCFHINSLKGKSKKELWKVISPTSGKKNTKRLNEFDKFRKLCLLYRLIHFDDQLPEVEINHGFREEELVNPMLRVFCKSLYKDNIVNALDGCLESRHRVRLETIEAKMYHVIQKLDSGEVLSENPFNAEALKKFNEDHPKFLAISIERLEDLLLQEIEGQWKYWNNDSPSRTTMISNRYGEITGPKRSSILKDKFGGKSIQLLNADGDRFRVWVITREIFDSLKNSYIEYEHLKILNITEDSEPEDYESMI